MFYSKNTQNEIVDLPLFHYYNQSPTTENIDPGVTRLPGSHTILSTVKDSDIDLDTKSPLSSQQYFGHGRSCSTLLCLSTKTDPVGHLLWTTPLRLPSVPRRRYTSTVTHSERSTQPGRRNLQWNFFQGIGHDFCTVITWSLRNWDNGENPTHKKTRL